MFCVFLSFRLADELEIESRNGELLLNNPLQQFKLIHRYHHRFLSSMKSLISNAANVTRTCLILHKSHSSCSLALQHNHRMGERVIQARAVVATRGRCSRSRGGNRAPAVHVPPRRARLRIRPNSGSIFCTLIGVAVEIFMCANIRIQYIIYYSVQYVQIQ